MKGPVKNKRYAKDPLAVFEGMKAQALQDARAVRIMTNLIAEHMENMFDQPYRIEIDNDAGYVLVRPV